MTSSKRDTERLSIDYESDQLLLARLNVRRFYENHDHNISIFFPAVVCAQSNDDRQRQDVIKMFSDLLPKMDVRQGDGSGSDLDCVFATSRDQSFHRDAAGNPTEPFRPHELLSIQQALDPLTQHPNMFCDYAERNAQAQKLAQDSKRTIAVASVGFSYPDFDYNLHTATVYYQRWSGLYLPQQGKRLLPVGSNGIIVFVKKNATWSFTITHLAKMN